MKDSGIPWVGEIPEDWETRRLKYLLSERNSRTATGDEDLLSVSIHDGVVPSRYIRERTNLASSLVGYKHVLIGDMVFNKLNPNMARFAYSEYEGITSPDFAVYYPKEPISVDMRFLTYLIRTPLYVERIKQLTSGVGEGFARLYTPDLFGIAIGLPPLDEQQRIADFLDKRCGEIDEAKQTLSDEIEALQRLRKATIHKAVTKGLDESAPMKDSGVEWIGEIPEGWNRSKLLHGLSQPITDGPHETPVLYDEGIPFVSAEAVSAGKGKIDFSHIRGYISEDYYVECCRKYIPRKNDIYMIKSGATTGRVALVTGDEPIFTIWSPLAAIRCDEVLLHYNYCFYFMQSYCFQNQVQDAWTFGTQQNIGMRSIEQLMVCLPSLDEQQRIADYLDKRCGEIDSIIETRTKQLERFEDYRKALVFAYVTGKKEVSVHE